MKVDIKKVKKAINGNKETFCEIVEENKLDLLKIARTRLNEDDAYDAIQETIISAYSSIERLSKPDKFKSWIITILVNKCNDIYYEKRNIYSIEEMYEKEQEVLQIDDSKLEIEDILRYLSEEEKIIVTLFYLEDLTSKEISKVLKINENTIKTKLARAKTKIRNKFGGVKYE